MPRPAPAVTDPLPGMRCRHISGCRAVAKPADDTAALGDQQASMVHRYAQHLELAHNMFNREQARSTASTVVSVFAQDILTRRQQAADRRDEREQARAARETTEPQNTVESDEGDPYGGDEALRAEWHAFYATGGASAERDYSRTTSF